MGTDSCDGRLDGGRGYKRRVCAPVGMWDVGSGGEETGREEDGGRRRRDEPGAGYEWIDECDNTTISSEIQPENSSWGDGIGGIGNESYGVTGG